MDNEKILLATKKKISIYEIVGVMVMMLASLSMAAGIITGFFSDDKDQKIKASSTLDITYKDTAIKTVSLSDLGITKTNDVVLDSVVKSKNQHFAKFQQLYNGVPVIGGRSIVYLVDNEVAYINDDIKKDINISVAPEIKSEQAISSVKESLSEQVATGISASPEAERVLPLPQLYHNIQGEGVQYDFSKLTSESVTTLTPEETLVVYPYNDSYILAWQVETPFIEELPAQFTYFINAQTGEIVEVRDNLIYYDVSGTVTGLEWEEPVTDGIQLEKPFRNNYVTIGEEQTTTDSNGNYQFTGLSGSQALNAYLQGPWVNVVNDQLDEALHSTLVNEEMVHNWNWSDSDNSYKNEESNAFYHVNRIHDYIASLDVVEMDFPLLTKVNINDACNAYFLTSPFQIGFYQQGEHTLFSGEVVECESTALISDVIYHEYGHALIHTLNPALLASGYAGQSGNLHEGIADYWACTVNNDPEQGEGFFFGDPKPLRICNSDDHYPENYDREPHAGAQIISGALWDVRESLSPEILDQILTDALRLQPVTFSEFLESLLVIDDSNADISDGTPNITVFCSSFWNHGIFHPACAGYTTQPVSIIINPGHFLDRPVSVTRSQPIEIEGTALGTSIEALTQYVFEYSSDGETWSEDGITLDNDGTIPVLGGHLGTWDAGSLADGLWYMRLTVYTESNSKESTWPVFLAWLGISSESPVSVGNIDPAYAGDEIAIIADYWAGMGLYVFHSDGTVVDGFPVYVQQAVEPPSLGDIDNDGYLEIVVPSSQLPYIYAFNHDGTDLNDNWPIIAGISGHSSPVLEDVAGDGFLEIIVNTSSGLLVIDQYGDKILDFPKGSKTSPAVADINNDGEMEFVINWAESNSESGWISHVIIYDNEGNISNGVWPVDITGKMTRGMIVGDIDPSTPEYEIVGIACDLVGEWCDVYIWTHMGEVLNDNWPVRVQGQWIGGSSLANIISQPGLDFDPLEILFITDDSLYALDFVGNLILSDLPGQSIHAPIAADVNGDGQADIMYGTGPFFWDPEPVRLYVIDSNGQNIIEPFDSVGAVYSPAAADIDRDGKIEIVASSSMGVHVIDFDSPYSTPEWQQYQNDARHTGLHTERIQCGDINNDGILNILDITLVVNYAFRNGPEPEPFEVGDIDKDGDIDIVDITILAGHIFRGEPAPEC
ncbi:FG-GAP-like repeat-containing protein [Patescibacteria group bacterium]